MLYYYFHILFYYFIMLYYYFIMLYYYFIMLYYYYIFAVVQCDNSSGDPFFLSLPIYWLGGLLERIKSVTISNCLFVWIKAKQNYHPSLLFT